uniref:Thiol-disulfide oxidoreductase DCC n=1 Tax=Prymnesium polylepis TaxID=72548 RepID=A0A6V4C9H8_9EUKA|mmetsp:Transcript_74311/g.204763  ORF Transcript_74311/g.204763 Transcript_74311/m.204763 type:complete len:197 (-) Transcript_74311:474-1064(-)
MAKTPSPATSEAKRSKAPRSYVRSIVLSALVTAVATAAALVPEQLQPPPNTHSLLMFDGVCNLCDGFVNFVADSDSAMRVRFGAQQKHMDLLERVGAPTDLSTLILIQGEKHFIYTEAVLRTFALMDWPWKGLAAGYILPGAIRDALYKLVAKYRYMVFGKMEACRVPTGDFKRRFIDYDGSDEPEVDAIAGKTLG